MQNYVCDDTPPGISDGDGRAATAMWASARGTATAARPSPAGGAAATPSRCVKTRWTALSSPLSSGMSLSIPACSVPCILCSCSSACRSSAASAPPETADDPAPDPDPDPDADALTPLKLAIAAAEGALAALALARLRGTIDALDLLGLRCRAATAAAAAARDAGPRASDESSSSSLSSSSLLLYLRSTLSPALLPVLEPPDRRLSRLRRRRAAMAWALRGLAPSLCPPAASLPLSLAASSSSDESAVACTGAPERRFAAPLPPPALGRRRDPGPEPNDPEPLMPRERAAGIALADEDA